MTRLTVLILTSLVAVSAISSAVSAAAIIWFMTNGAEVQVANIIDARMYPVAVQEQRPMLVKLTDQSVSIRGSVKITEPVEITSSERLPVSIDYGSVVRVDGDVSVRATYPLPVRSER